MTPMLGRAAAGGETAPRRWVQRAWGYPFLPVRQDWHMVWPLLAALPRSGVRLLDAGCGPGRWSLKIAARRPGWRVTGMDRNEEVLQHAECRRRRLGLRNLAFVRSDFGQFSVRDRFDVTLSVCATHYLAVAGRPLEPIGCLARALRPGGLMILYGPRRAAEVPFVRWLPRPEWQPVYSADELSLLCAGAGLALESLEARVGPLGTLAQQLDRVVLGRWRRPAMLAGLYPVELLLAAADARNPASPRRGSLMWLLTARRPVDGGRDGA